MFFSFLFLTLDSAYYYGNNDGSTSSLQNSNTLLVGGNENLDLNSLHTQPLIPSHEIRSPLAATRATSSASAASPTGSACAASSASN